MAKSGATLTAEQMTAKRREVKARQKAVAQAASKHKGGSRFSIQEAQKDSSRRSMTYVADKGELRKAREANGDKLLAFVRANGAVTLKSIEDVGDAAHEEWVGNCRDLIEAIKRAKDFTIQWNKDWYEQKRLSVGIVRS